MSAGFVAGPVLGPGDREGTRAQACGEGGGSVLSVKWEPGFPDLTPTSPRTSLPSQQDTHACAHTHTHAHAHTTYASPSGSSPSRLEGLQREAWPRPPILCLFKSRPGVHAALSPRTLPPCFPLGRSLAFPSSMCGLHFLPFHWPSVRPCSVPSVDFWPGQIGTC